MKGPDYRLSVHKKQNQNGSLFWETGLQAKPVAKVWFETWGSWVLKAQQKEVRSTRFRVSSRELFIQYTQICLFLQSRHFGKCSHLIVLYIIGYNNISWRCHDPPSQNLELLHPQPP